MSDSVIAVDFHYEFENVFSPNADQYLIGQTNMVKNSENWGGGRYVTYWSPSISTGQGELIYRFDFPTQSRDIALKFRLASFNFGSSYGSIVLEGSNDGIAYFQIAANDTPSTIDNITFYSINLGANLIGTKQLYLKVSLDVVGWNIMAQFLRADNQDPNLNPIFSISENGAIAVPEPSVLMLISIAVIVFYTLHGHKKM